MFAIIIILLALIAFGSYFVWNSIFGLSIALNVILAIVVFFIELLLLLIGLSKTSYPFKS